MENKIIPTPLTAVADALPPMANSAKLAEITGLSKHTFDTWRSLGEGPKFMKIGGRALYAREDVLAWLADHR